MNEPRVIESVTNECQSLGRAHESSSARAEQLIACLEGEIAKRDARIMGLESQYQRDVWGLNNEGDPIGGEPAGGYANDNARLRAELAAIKAQEPAAWTDGAGAMYSASLMASLNISSGGLTPLYAAPVVNRKLTTECKRCLGTARVDIGTVCDNWVDCPECAAPVSEAKAQGEYGDAYQGAREDLAIWKRRALEAEEKVLQQEQIIDHLTSDAQGESRFGEPVVTPDAPCVPDGYVLADKKALGTVLQALVNAPHHIRELQVTRQPVELFSDNPINVLIANYEAPAAPVQQPKCKTCDDNGRIGGPSFCAPDEGGEPCPDCCSPVQQVSVQGGL